MNPNPFQQSSDHEKEYKILWFFCTLNKFDIPKTKPSQIQTKFSVNLDADKKGLLLHIKCIQNRRQVTARDYRTFFLDFILFFKINFYEETALLKLLTL